MFADRLILTIINISPSLDVTVQYAIIPRHGIAADIMIIMDGGRER